MGIKVEIVNPGVDLTVDDPLEVDDDDKVAEVVMVVVFVYLVVEYDKESPKLTLINCFASKLKFIFT